MKSFLLLSLITILLNSVAFAQPIIEWQRTFGGTLGEDMGDAILTFDNGYLLAGNSSSGIGGNKTEGNNGLSDYWIVKLDSLGNIEWQNTIGSDSYDHPTKCIQLPDSSYFIAGHSLSGISSDKSEPNIGERDYWIMKLDVNGVVQWEKTIGGDQADILRDAAYTFDGGFLLGGHSLSGISGDKTQASIGNEDYWLVKVDAVGNVLWDKTIGGNDVDYLFALTKTVDSGFILGGSSRSDISGDKTENSMGINDMWVVKIDSIGAIVWQNTIGGTQGDALFDLTNSSDSGFVLAGQSSSGISGDKTEIALGNGDYWVVKIDSLGIVVWDNTIGGNSGDQAQSIQETSDLGFIINGVSDSEISGDKTEPVRGNSSAFDFWVVKIDQTGNLIWEKTIGGDDTEQAGFGFEAPDGGYLIGGRSSSDINGDKTQLTLGSSDYWIVKLSCDGTDVDQDGYCIAEDCNDNDSLVNPGMTEIQCNGIDDDCNPLTLDDDITNPIAPVLADSISECSITLAVPTTTDNCAGTIMGTTSDPITYSSDGNYTVNWTFDDGNGNSIIVPQNVMIDDVTDPIQIVLGDSLGQCSASVQAPSTTDNCGGTILGTTTQPLTYNTQGQFIVYWVFDDGNGNLVVSPQTIIIEDTMAPDTPLLPDLIGDCSVIAVAPLASDNCAGAITGTTTDPLSYSVQGTYTINWTFDDGNGNSIVVPQNVIVDDVTDPIAPTLSDIIDECSLTATAPTTTDNCAGTITGTTSTVFPITAQGTTIVTWSFDDGYGNVLTVDQNIIIADNTAPLADIASLPDVTSGCDITSLNPPTATDNCTGVVSVTNDAVFPITTGTTSITWTYEDQNGNTSSQMQNVIVSPMDITTSLDAGGVEITANNSSAAYQWIDCLNNNSPISGETNQVFTATYNGEFAVELTEGGCVDTSSCTVISQVDLIESSLLNSIKVYPNPTNGNLTIASDFNIDRLRVIDPQGREIMSKLNLSNIEALDLSRCDSGVYFLMIETVHGTEKFMVEKVD